MKKSDLLKALLAGAAAFIPGGAGVEAGIDALIHRNADPDDDVDEITAAIAQIAVGAMLAAEGLTEKDVVHDDIFQLVVANIKGDITLLQHLVVRHAAAPKDTP